MTLNNMNTLDKIVNLLIPISNKDASSIEAGENANSIYEIVSTLLPDNTLMYDSEIIEDIDDYNYILKGYASLTNSEWSPSNIQTSGDLNTILNVTFTFDNKNTVWKIEQNGSDYVCGEFLAKISSFSSRNLPGTFVHISTNDQMISVVYLPKEIARKFKTASNKVLTIDSACKAIKNNDEALIQKTWFDNALHDTKGILEDRDKEGDTLYTSAIKGGNKNYTEYIKDIGANLVCPGADGKTPYDIAREHKMDEEAEYLLESFTEESNGWDEVVKIVNEHSEEFNEQFKMFVSTVSTHQSRNLLHPFLCPYVRMRLYIGIKPKYFTGENVVSVFGTSNISYLLLSYSTIGDDSAYLSVNCDQKEAMTYIEKLVKIAKSS